MFVAAGLTWLGLTGLHFAINGLSTSCGKCGKLFAGVVVDSRELSRQTVMKTRIEEDVHRDVRGLVIGTTERRVERPVEEVTKGYLRKCKHCGHPSVEKRTSGGKPSQPYIRPFLASVTMWPLVAAFVGALTVAAAAPDPAPHKAKSVGQRAPSRAQVHVVKSCNVRAGPSTGHEVVGSVRPGERLGRRGAKVRWVHTTKGWIHGSCLNE